MCKYYTEKLRKANFTQEIREYSVSPEIDTEQDADVDNSVEQAFLDGVNGVVFDWNVDSVAEKGYNSERGENYAATDEFRGLQEESKGMDDKQKQLFHSGDRQIDETLRERLSGILSRQVGAVCGRNGNANGLLRLNAKGNRFNIYEGVDGRNLDGYGNNFESEVIFPRNSDYVVDRVSYNNNGQPIIYMTEVTENGREKHGQFHPEKRSKTVQSLSKSQSRNGDLQDISRENTSRSFSRQYKMQGVQAEGTGQLKQNSGVSEADSSESASFMPENESVLPDVSAADGETDSYEAFTKRYNGTLELTEDQKLIQSICTALGTEAVFKNLDRWATGKDGKRRFFSPDGYFDKATGKIYINTSTNGKHNPLLFVIKHELTHFGEINKTAYDSFVKAVKKSKEFKAWLEYKTGMKGETADRMAAKLGADIRDERSKYGIELGVAESEQEVIANFAGDILFAKSGKTLDSLLNSVEAKQRPKVIQAVVDFFRWLREKLSGNKDLTFKLQRLESKYSAMLKGAQKAAENTNSTGEGGKEYSAAASSADVLDLVRKVKSGDFKANEKIYFDDVSDELAAKIENLTGINVKGFKVAIEARQIEHILKDHGENGKSDHSMSSDEDIAKMEYVLKNPDGLSLSGKTQAYSYMKNGHNKTADTVLYDKAIGNKSYYVVQAVPDTKAKTLYVVSAFIGEKGYKKEASQLINAKSPDATAKPGSVVASDNRVAQNEPSVNSNSTQETLEYSISEDVDTEQGTDYTAEFDKVTEQFEKGDITRAEFIEQVKQLYTEAGKTYGTIPKGETVTGNENFDNPAPKKVNSKTKVSTTGCL